MQPAVTPHRDEDDGSYSKGPLLGGSSSDDDNSANPFSGALPGASKGGKKSPRRFAAEMALRLYTIICLVRVLEADRSLAIATSADTSGAIIAVGSSNIIAAFFWFLFGTPSMLRTLALPLLIGIVVAFPLSSCLCCCATAFVTGRGTFVFRHAWEAYEKRAAASSGDAA